MKNNNVIWKLILRSFKKVITKNFQNRTLLVKNATNNQEKDTKKSRPLKQNYYRDINKKIMANVGIFSVCSQR